MPLNGLLLTLALDCNSRSPRGGWCLGPLIFSMESDTRLRSPTRSYQSRRYRMALKSGFDDGTPRRCTFLSSPSRGVAL